MSRARTGTLVPPGRDGIWKGRVTAEDGSRPLYSLGTSDEAAAKRKLARLVAGELPNAIAGDTVKEYAEAWLRRREAHGVAMAKYERGYLEHHALDMLGAILLGDVKPTHIRDVLERAASKGLARGSVVQVRGVLHRLFDDAWRAEIIESNPVARVKMPTMREVKKERVILTDDEFTRFVACADVDLELRMLGLVARVIGGMRAGDLNAWDWTMIDTKEFRDCAVPRSKTAKPQALAIPPSVAPFLRAWHERAGKPASGPVFPARGGKSAGAFKAKKGAYAARLRKGLIAARIFRLPASELVRAVRTGRGENTRSVVDVVPDKADALYFETASSLPVDFHSFRRAFNTALAEAGVNVQHAMHLAAHSDPKVHQRYVASTVAMRTIPAAAVPQLPANPASIVTTCDDSASAKSRLQGNPGAGHGVRTRDIQLGKLALYQLS